ncbi:MAG: flagellar protein FlgJ [Oceanicoccus sp.]
MINTASVNSGADSYTDLSNLNSIRSLGRSDKNGALEKIAEQFESMLVRMMMKSMRDANDVFAEGNMLTSNEGGMYQEMYDDQLALSLSQGRGIGIADVMVRQLKQRFGVDESGGENKALQDYLQSRNNANGAVSTAITSRSVNAELTSTPSSNQAAVSAPTEIDDHLFDGSSEKFVVSLYPIAEKAAAMLGVAPELLMAQAALETGWGKKIITQGDKSSFNLFNIKADSRWQGGAVNVSTLEVRNGTAVKEMAAFRAYSSPQQSFDDYVDFINNSPRYEEAREATDAESYIRNLSEAGYATDPNYADKVLRVMNSNEMKKAVANVQAANVEG